MGYLAAEVHQERKNTDAYSRGRWRSTGATASKRRTAHGIEEARSADRVLCLSGNHARNSRRAESGCEDDGGIQVVRKVDQRKGWMVHLEGCAGYAKA